MIAWSRKVLVCSWVCALPLASSAAFASLLQHGVNPPEVHAVTGKFVDMTWTVSSSLTIDGSEPHETGIGGGHSFEFQDIFTIANRTDSALGFVGLIVPGLPVLPEQIHPGDSLADRQFQLAWRIEGPGKFDYEGPRDPTDPNGLRRLPWTVTVSANRFLPGVTFTSSAGVTATLTSGPGSIGGSINQQVTYTPPNETGSVDFTTVGQDRLFVMNLITTEALQQTFFASGGKIVINGFVVDTGEGESRILFENVNWPTVQSPGPEFQWVTTNPTALVTTQVFDRFISTAPEPSSVALFGLGIGLFGFQRYCRGRVARLDSINGFDHTR